MTRKNGQHLIVPRRHPPDAPDLRVNCGQKPACAGCPYPAHGFICWFQDGACLRTAATKHILEVNAHENEKHTHS